jgi:hypothetical protein
MYTLRDPGATFKGSRYRPHLANFRAPSLLPLSDRLHLELARAGLDGQRKRPSFAYGKLVAGDTAKDGRDALTEG